MERVANDPRRGNFPPAFDFAGPLIARGRARAILCRLNPYVPMPLRRMREPFDHPEWLFEPKYDGFRALLFLGRHPEFVSRSGLSMARFAELAIRIDRELGRSAVLDGEIVCFDAEGRPRFYDLIFRRGTPCFVVFDVLTVEGRDLRALPLINRKRILRRLIPRRSSVLLFADWIDRRGHDFFRAVCARDLEGIVAKWKPAPYRADLVSSWVKIKNREYTEARDRHELFDR